ncbi:transposase [Microvirga sp. TS319]|uniref:transposase n=1 Tax=Microvirga sp. TS319 TaxID=3241165 RepID=UPI00351A6734
MCKPHGDNAHMFLSPSAPWQRLTVLAALTCEGLVATMSTEASTTTSVLLACIEQVLVPTLRLVRPDAILVMENLRPDHATEVIELLAQTGIGLLYLPRYSPVFNPIEQAQAKVARTLEALEAELKPSLDTITAKDTQGWISMPAYHLR